MSNTRSSFNEIVKKMGIDEPRGNDKAAMNSKENMNIQPQLQPQLPKIDKTTIIGSDVKIVGDLKAENNIEFYGEIKGNIETAGTLKLNGNTEGNIKADNLILQKATVNGNIVSDDKISLDKDTSVIGDLSAKTVIIGGSLKGNVFAEDTVLIQEEAVIKGDINTNLIDIRQGAQICGKIETGQATKNKAVQKA